MFLRRFALTARRRTGAAGPLLALAVLLPLACSDAAPASARPEAPEPAVAATPRVTQGLDSVLLASGFQRAAELPRLRSLLVARHGAIQREAYHRGAGPDRPTNVKSVSKSLVSALVGIALAEGKLEGVDQPIRDFFPQQIQADADPRKREITLGNLLSMQAGLRPTSFDNYGAWVNSPNWVRYALAQPMTADPGGRMLYSTGSTHLLSAIVTRATGKSTLAYARERLARPLGIQMRPWPTDPQGIYFGGNEMRLTPREMLRFGELYRNGGVWEGRRIIPSEWIEQSWTPRTVSPFNGHRYGYGWWIREVSGRPVYFAWGYGGQYIFIVPSLELTVVVTSDAGTGRDGGHLREVHRLVSDWIVPAAERGGRAAVTIR